MNISERDRIVVLAPWRGWFLARWPASGRGVELVARIPGYLAETVTQHDDLPSAEAAAQAIYDEYTRAIEVLKAS